MKINLQESFEKIKSHYHGLNLSQWENYWNWYLEINSPNQIFKSSNEIFKVWMQNNLKGIPLAYILGQWAFYQDLFFVNEHTLIPRPETEMLVELTLKEINKPMKILEIGVGSGAVFLSIMLNCTFPIDMTATDISANALKCAQKNYEVKKYFIHRDHKLTFLKTDRTKDLTPNYYDIIVCNPPYIPENQTDVSAQVRKFEPDLALFLKNEIYYTWMLELISGIVSCLKVQGIAFLEGHEKFLNTLKDMAEIKFRHVQFELINDLNGLPRFIKITS